MDSPEIYEVKVLRAQVKKAKDILEKILYSDERGQGTGYAESMKEAAMFIAELDAQ